MVPVAGILKTNLVCGEEAYLFMNPSHSPSNGCKVGTQHRKLQAGAKAEAMDKGCWLTQPYFLCKQDHQPRERFPRGSWIHPHQPAIKKTLPRLASRSVCWRHFLNWGLFSDDSIYAKLPKNNQDNRIGAHPVELDRQELWQE